MATKKVFLQHIDITWLSICGRNLHKYTFIHVSSNTNKQNGTVTFMCVCEINYKIIVTKQNNLQKKKNNKINSF